MDQQAWDALVQATPGGSFLQSWGWGELQTELKNTFWRLQEDDGVALVIKRPLRLGQHWLYVPRGPLASTAATEQQLLAQVLELARAEQAAFIRIEPPLSTTNPTDPTFLAAIETLRAAGWRTAVQPVQPIHTLLLDLTKSPEELQAAMHHKTRYNIKVGQRQGVTVRFSRDSNDVEHFIRLTSDVAERSKFHYHPADYYRKFMQVLDHHGAQLALAEHAGEILAVNIIMTFGNTTTYVHGASSSAKRSLMAPYVLQWETIKRAQAQGSTQYDFYGVAPVNATPDHPWAGITRFKLGFGGHRQEYPGALDLVQSKLWYSVYRAAHMLQKK